MHFEGSGCGGELPVPGTKGRVLSLFRVRSEVWLTAGRRAARCGFDQLRLHFAPFPPIESAAVVALQRFEAGGGH